EGHPEDLPTEADEYESLDITNLGSIPHYFLDRDVTELYLLGDVNKRQIFDESRLDNVDSTVDNLLSTIDNKGDQNLIRAGVRYLEMKGLDVRGVDDLFDDLIPRERVLAGPDCRGEFQDTLSVLEPVATSMADYEVGQSVFGKNETVVAVEAVEGTSQTIRRAGEQAGENCIMLKVARSNQDMRFDVPVTGVETVRQLMEIDAAALFIEAGNTLWVQREECRKLAEKNGIGIYSWERPGQSAFGRVFQWFRG
ncbi:MAG: UDP-2,3-diacylglucosamine diphosphatase LpxI domain-containing protein, partial [bacterium]